MTDETDLLFVYGTLRKDAKLPSHHLLRKGTELIGRAYMNGRMYEIDRYPGVVHSASETEQVVGDLYRLHEPAAVLAVLDDYEEAGQNFPEPREYRRVQVTVKRECGTEVVAWRYLYNRPTTGLRLIPSGDWCG